MILQKFATLFLAKVLLAAFTYKNKFPTLNISNMNPLLKEVLQNKSYFT